MGDNRVSVSLDLGNVISSLAQWLPLSVFSRESTQDDESNIQDDSIDVENSDVTVELGGQEEPTRERVVEIDSLLLILRWILSLIPFAFMLLLIFMYLNYTSCLLVVVLYTAALRINTQIVKQNDLKENRQIYILLGLLIFLVTAPSAYVWIFRSYLSKLLLFQPHIPNSSVLSGLWFTLSNGILLKYVTMSAKVVILLWMNNIRKRKYILGLIEEVSTFLSITQPIVIWFSVIADKQWLGMMGSLLFTFLYLSFKCLKLWHQLQKIIISVSLTIQGHTFARIATPEELNRHPEGCAICQDEFNFPVALSCDHIYCEECISSWLDNEKTCPLCRKEIENTGQKVSSNGSTDMVIEMF